MTQVQPRGDSGVELVQHDRSCYLLDTRVTLHTDDGELINMTYLAVGYGYLAAGGIGYRVFAVR